MKISIVQGAFLPVPPVRGGAIEKVWTELGVWLAARGHEVTHVSRAWEGQPAEEIDRGVRRIRVAGEQASRNLWVLKGRDLRYSFRALAALPSADLVVTHTFWLPTLLRGGRRGRIYVHVGRYPRGQLGLYRRAVRWQTVSTAIADAMREQVPADEGRIKVIPYFLPAWPARARAIPAGRRRDGEVHLLYAGRIHPEKGLHLLLAALARLPGSLAARVRLRVVGPWRTSDGGAGEEYRERLKAAASLLRARVEFEEPRFGIEELFDAYRAADLFLYPSLAEKGETFGVAPLEAMACGCPPLVSDLGCFRDFIRHQHDGIVFDHRGEEGESRLAAALAPIIENPAMLAPMGEAAVRKASNYRIEQVAPLYEADFQRLCAIPRPIDLVPSP